MKRVNERGCFTIETLGGRSLRVLAAGVFVLLAQGAQAEAILEESYELSAGGDPIYVLVEPLEKPPPSALSAIDWESLWTWLPSEDEPRRGRWLVTYRDQPTFLGTLFSLT